MKTSIYIATSLDGFIARENGDLDWLPVPNGGNDGDYGYAAFLSTVDFIVMSRHTFEKARTFGDWPYRQKRVVVLASQPVNIPADLSESIEWMSCSPAEIVSQLAGRGARHLYIDGGKTIQRFLKSGIIERLIITRVPVLIGRGIPLFGSMQRDIRLRHVSTRSFESGLVQSEYEVATV